MSHPRKTNLKVAELLLRKPEKRAAVKLAQDIKAAVGDGQETSKAISALLEKKLAGIYKYDPASGFRDKFLNDMMWLVHDADFIISGVDTLGSGAIIVHSLLDMSTWAERVTDKPAVPGETDIQAMHRMVELLKTFIEQKTKKFTDDFTAEEKAFLKKNCDDLSDNIKTIEQLARSAGEMHQNIISESVRITHV